MEKITIKTRISIYQLLKNLKLSNKKIALELNGMIIQKINYKKKFLKSNDKVEIVHFIGGG